MPDNDEMRAIYEAAGYGVQPEDGAAFTLRIGQRSAAADALMARRDPPSLTLMTAMNPMSVALPAAENAARNASLRQDLATERLRHHPSAGESTMPDGAMAETGFAVADMDRAAMRRLGLRYGQNAVVRIERGGAAELVELITPDMVPDLDAGGAAASLRERGLLHPRWRAWAVLHRFTLSINAPSGWMEDVPPPPPPRHWDGANAGALRVLFDRHLAFAEADAARWRLTRVALWHAADWVALKARRPFVH